MIFLNSVGLLRTSSHRRLKLPDNGKKGNKKLVERSTSFSSTPFLFDKTRRLPCLPVSYRTLLQLTILLILVCTLLLGFWGSHLQSTLPLLAERLSQNPLEGPLLFLTLTFLWTLCLVPSPLLALTAGLLFQSLPLAISLVTAGSAIGQACSFLIGRSFLRSLLAEGVKGSPSFPPLQATVAEEGWRFVLLLRLASAAPFNGLLNYVLALTPIQPSHYIFASVIGIIPGLSFFAYFGSLLSNAAALLGGPSDPHRKVTFILLAISGALVTLIASLISSMAHKAILQALEKRKLEADQKAREVRKPSIENIPTEIRKTFEEEEEEEIEEEEIEEEEDQPQLGFESGLP